MAARFLALHMISHSAPSSSYSAHNDYLITVHWQGHPTGLHQSALLYVILRDVLRTGHYRPTQLEKDRLSERFTRDLAGVFHGLVVSVLRRMPDSLFTRLVPITPLMLLLSLRLFCYLKLSFMYGTTRRMHDNKDFESRDE